MSSILIVDDHPLYRQALSMEVSAVLPDAAIFRAGDITSGLRLLGQNNDLRLALLDLNLPGIHGIEAIAMVRGQYPQASILVVSGSQDERDRRLASEAGAHAFVSKLESPEALRASIRAALNNSQLSAQQSKATLNNNLDLTPRQREVLYLLAQGLSNHEIASSLEMAETTVKVHMTAIFKALGVVNRTQAALAAKKLGVRTG